MFVATVFGDPVRKPAETMFRAGMIGAAGVFGAFFWGLFRSRPMPPQLPQEESATKEPTVAATMRRKKRTRLATRVNRDGTRDTVLEVDEEHYE